MTYTDFIQQLPAQTSAVSYEKGLEMIIPLCRKLLSDYHTFYVRNQWGDPEVLEEAIRCLEAANAGVVNQQEIEPLSERLYAVIPYMEDFGDYDRNASSMEVGARALALIWVVFVSFRIRKRIRMTTNSPLFRFILGVILLTLLDCIGAIASDRMHFKYIRLIAVSLAIYVFIGFFLAKVTSYPVTALYMGLLGLFDGTIGLRLSIHFNANMGLTEEQIEKMQSVRTAVWMIFVGISFGSLGYAIAQWL